MTWGSNASYDTIPCRWCGADCVDDTDEGESSGERFCCHRPRWWIGRLFHRKHRAVKELT